MPRIPAAEQRLRTAAERYRWLQCRAEQHIWEGDALVPYRDPATRWIIRERRCVNCGTVRVQRLDDYGDRAAPPLYRNRPKGYLFTGQGRVPRRVFMWATLQREMGGGQL